MLSLTTISGSRRGPAEAFRHSLGTILLIALHVTFAVSGLRAQTVTLSDANIVQSSPYRVGINIGSVNNYDSGQVLKNLFGALNVGFEPLYVNSIWVAQKAGTTTTFVNPNPYDTPSANQLAGATYTIVESTTAAKGCTGTIKGNTAGANSVYTLGTPCAAPTSPGDQMLVYYPQFPTAESTWESSGNNVYSRVTNGGKVTTDSTSPYDGKQSVLIDTSAGGAASAEVDFYADMPVGRILLNGTYTVSVAAKRVSGTAVASVYVGRFGGPTCNLTLSSITTGWAVYSNNACTFSETPSGVSQGIKLAIYQSGSGITDIDDVSFAKTSGQNSANTTPFRDEVVATLQSMCGSTGPKCLVRDWLNQDAETFANWTANATAAAQGYPGSTQATTGSSTPRLQDYLALVQLVNGIPYLEVPSTFTNADASSLITYLAANWVGTGKPFPEIYLSFCNECWNLGPSGHTLPYRSNQPYQYYDYAVRESDLYHTMRANSSFSSAMHLGMNLQLGVTSGLSNALPMMAGVGGSPDYMEFAPYTQSTVANWQTPSALWSSAFEEPWGNVVDPSSSSGYYQATTYVQGLHLCGSAGVSTCFVTDYEQNNSTVQTCGGNYPACTGGANTAIDQQHEDYITAGAGQGIITPLQALLNLQQLGVRAQNLWALTESFNYTLCGPSNCPAGQASIAKLWGSVADMGGQASAVNAATFGGSYSPRPQLLGIQLANRAIVGPMFSCPVTGTPIYNWAGDALNGPTHALNNVPYLYAFCFRDTASHRAMVLINTNLTNAYQVGFAGTNVPSGTVSLWAYTPPSLNVLNEGLTGTSAIPTATLSLVASTLNSPSSIAVPPASALELEWDIPGGPPALSFTSIPSQTYGAAPFPVSATSNSAGAVTYSVASGPATIAGNVVTVTGVGTVTLQASQAASGSYSSASAAATFNVVAATPTLSFAAISDQTAGVSMQIAATSNSPAPISYSVLSGPATISGTTVSLTGLGTVTLQANQAASSNYTSATATTSFRVLGETPTLSFVSIPNQIYGAASFKVSATSNSPGSIAYQVVSGPASLSTNVLTVTGIGTVSLLATQAATGNFTSGMATTTFSISAAVPALNFNPVSNQSYGVAPFAVSATSNSAGAITYSVVSGPASISASVVTIMGAGTVTLQASQAAAGGYTASTTTTSFTVNPIWPALYINPISTKSYGAAPFAITSETNSSGAMTYLITNGPASVSGSTITLTGAGTITLWANQAASGGYSAATAAINFTVNPIVPTLAFNPIPTQSYGAAPFPVSAVSNSAGAISYSVVSGPATLFGNTLALTGAGTVTLQASLAAAGGYSGATTTISFVVNPIWPGMAINPIPTIPYGAAPFTVTARTNSAGAITYLITSGPATISGSTITPMGPGKVTLWAIQAAAGGYAAATGTTNFIISP